MILLKQGIIMQLLAALEVKSEKLSFLLWMSRHFNILLQKTTFMMMMKWMMIMQCLKINYYYLLNQL